MMKFIQTPKRQPQPTMEAKDFLILIGDFLILIVIGVLTLVLIAAFG